jgi:hypothetical protein
MFRNYYIWLYEEFFLLHHHIKDSEKWPSPQKRHDESSFLLSLVWKSNGKSKIITIPATLVKIVIWKTDAHL